MWVSKFNVQEDQLSLIVAIGDPNPTPCCATLAALDNECLTAQ